jgi:hypothetical protein
MALKLAVTDSAENPTISDGEIFRSRLRGVIGNREEYFDIRAPETIWFRSVLVLSG